MKGIWGNLATGVIAGAFLCTSALATTVNEFDLAGGAVGNMNGISFTLDNTFTTDTQTAIDVIPDRGVFSDLTVGTTQVIQNLTSSNGVTPGSSFDFKNWIQLTDGIDIDATGIPVETSVPVCSGGPIAVGQSCRPNNASPVIFTQTISGVVAKLTVDGFAHGGAAGSGFSIVGVFSNPSSNYATVPDFLAAFASPGGAQVSFSADFIGSPSSSVPEPGSMILLASGLLGFGLLRKRKTSR